MNVREEINAAVRRALEAAGIRPAGEPNPPANPAPADSDALAAARAEQERLKAENDRLSAAARQREEADAAAAKVKTDALRSAASAAAVTAFGQGTDRHKAAQADIDACTSDGEIERLTRAYNAAAPGEFAPFTRRSEPGTEQPAASLGADYYASIREDVKSRYAA